MYEGVNAFYFNWSLTGKPCMEWLCIVDESFPLKYYTGRTTACGQDTCTQVEIDKSFSTCPTPWKDIMEKGESKRLLEYIVCF